jgi:hypothetical protein
MLMLAATAGEFAENVSAGAVTPAYCPDLTAGLPRQPFFASSSSSDSGSGNSSMGTGTMAALAAALSSFGVLEQDVVALQAHAKQLPRVLQQSNILAAVKAAAEAPGFATLTTMLADYAQASFHVA